MRFVASNDCYVGANCRAIDGTWRAPLLQCVAGTRQAEDGPLSVILGCRSVSAECRLL